MTPEQHTSKLMDAIERELTTYGPASLADVISSVASAYADTDDYGDRAHAWREVTRAFETLARNLSGVPLTVPHGYENEVKS